MPASSGYFQDTAWNFTLDSALNAPSHRRSHENSRKSTSFTDSRRDQVWAGDAPRVCCRGMCFSGLMVGLPLSLLIWAAACGAIYLLLH